MWGIFTAFAVTITLTAGVIRVLSKTAIEKLLMSYSSLILYRVVNVILIGLIMILLSVSIIHANEPFFLEKQSKFWIMWSEKFLWVLGSSFLVFSIIFPLSFLIYEHFKGNKSKKFLKATSGFYMLIISLIAVFAYMAIYTLTYTYYSELYAELSYEGFADILKIRMPIEIPIMIALVFFMYCLFTFMLYSVIRKLLRRKIIVTDATKEFNKGMSILYSIQPEIQVVLPINDNQNEVDVFPQYVHFIGTKKILKYDIEPRPISKRFSLFKYRFSFNSSLIVKKIRKIANLEK